MLDELSKAKTINLPDTLSLTFLPSYSPELNVIEPVRLYLKERYLSLRVRPDHDDVFDVVPKT